MGDPTLDGSIHAPVHSSGCYRQRLADCCAVCYLRLVADGAKGVLQNGS